MAEAGRRFRRSQWWPAFVTGLLRNVTLPPVGCGGTPRPTGKVLVADIRYLDEYAAVLRARDLAVTVDGSRLGRALWAIVTASALLPGVLQASRMGQPADMLDG